MFTGRPGGKLVCSSTWRKETYGIQRADLDGEIANCKTTAASSSHNKQDFFGRESVPGAGEQQANGREMGLTYCHNYLREQCEACRPRRWERRPLSDTLQRIRKLYTAADMS